MKISSLMFIGGMTMQALISAFLAATGSITLNAGQQAITAILFAIVLSFQYLFTKKVSDGFLGMGAQALITSMLAQVGLINLNSTQQLICAGLYLTLILIIVLYQEIRVKG